MLHRWITCTENELPFRFQLSNSSSSQMLDTALLYPEWRDFATLAKRFTSAGTSEANVERILSVQRQIGGINGTRFKIPTMKARLRIKGAKNLFLINYYAR